MKGTHQIIVESKRIRYRFVLRRNLTVIRGDSATGKTTLVDMIQQYVDNPSGSAVNVQCDKNCYVISGALWKSTLQGIQDGIIFIDEGNDFITTTEFAETISQTDNYYVIVTRESLPALPYSTEEIYGIRESGKYGTLKQTYNEFFRIYSSHVYTDKKKTEEVITEDSNSGHDFFQAVCKKKNITCESASGKSNLFRLASASQKPLLLIADGAAFGPEMDRIMKLIRSRDNITLYLPESFEWLILKSGIFKGENLKEILERPSDYIDSKEYFSWERFFTAYLISISNKTYLQYSKKKLNSNYKNPAISSKILGVIPERIAQTLS